MEYDFFDALYDAKMPQRVKDLIDDFSAEIEGVDDGLRAIGEQIWEKAFEAGREQGARDYEEWQDEQELHRHLNRQFL